MKLKDGNKVSCGTLITDGRSVYEVQSISGGIVWCKRLQPCEDDARFYQWVDDAEFSAAQVQEMRLY